MARRCPTCRGKLAKNGRCRRCEDQAPVAAQATAPVKPAGAAPRGELCEDRLDEEMLEAVRDWEALCATSKNAQEIEGAKLARLIVLQLVPNPDLEKHGQTWLTAVVNPLLEKARAAAGANHPLLLRATAFRDRVVRRLEQMIPNLPPDADVRKEATPERQETRCALPQPEPPARIYCTQHRLAQEYARDWWAAHPNRGTAVCDRCSAEIKRNQGCLVQGTGLAEGMLAALTSDRPSEVVLAGGTDLICDECFNEHTPANFKEYRAELDAMRATGDEAGTRPTSFWNSTESGRPAFSRPPFDKEVDDVPYWMWLIVAPMAAAAMAAGIYVGVSNIEFPVGCFFGFLGGAIVGMIPGLAVINVIRLALRMCGR